MFDLQTLVAIYLVTALAVWRIAYMLVYEEGMFGLASKIRTLAGVKIVTEKQPNPFGQLVDTKVAVADNWIGKGLTCFNCTSVWFAGIAGVVICLETGSAFSWQLVLWYFAHTLAVSGLAMVLRGISNQ